MWSKIEVVIEMVTKEECIQALKTITFELLRSLECRKWDDDKGKWVLKGKFQNKHDVLEKLIEEHFNNLP